MDIDHRKRIARDFIAGIAKGSFPVGMIAEDFVGWSSLSHKVERAEYLRRVAVIGQVFGKEGLRLTIDRIFGEDDAVAVQARGQGKLFNGDPYSQSYLFVVEFNDRDQVRHVREYFDTHLVHAGLLPAMQKWGKHAPAGEGA